MTRPLAPPPRRVTERFRSLAWLLLLLALTAQAQPKGGEQLSASRPNRAEPANARPSSASSAEPGESPIQIRIGPYRGWDRAWTISNGTTEAVVVPAVGRVMQFRFVGKDGPFWEDAALSGKPPNPESTEWGNFGGDKTWPSPQSEWEKVTGRSWPPPVAFDSMPVETSVRRDAVVLRSPVDPHFGIRTERLIRLDRSAPSMSIVTTYEKVEGRPVTVGVWIITQLEDPVAAFIPIPGRSLFPEGFNRQSGDTLPAGLLVQGGVLSLTRDPTHSTKIGTDSDRLLWVGSTQMLLIESPRIAGGNYPDQQSSAEIYTNPNPKSYVELETLGPLHTLSPGDRISQTNTYTLVPRKHADPRVDAMRVLSIRR